jgi:hypothetical protein
MKLSTIRQQQPPIRVAALRAGHVRLLLIAATSMVFLGSPSQSRARTPVDGSRGASTIILSNYLSCSDGRLLFVPYRWTGPDLSAVSRRSGVRLKVQKTSLRPLEVLRFAIDDSTDAGLSFGESFSIQIRSAGGWVVAPFSPSGEWAAVAHQLQPRSQGPPTAVRIPATASVGFYRVEKVVLFRGHRLTITAPFRVHD